MYSKVAYLANEPGVRVFSKKRVEFAPRTLLQTALIIQNLKQNFIQCVKSKVRPLLIEDSRY